MFKQKLPVFPLRCTTKDGLSFKAHFKKIGDPNLIGLNLTYKSDTRRITIPFPKKEVLSWGAFAHQFFIQCFSISEDPEEVPSNDKPKSKDLPLLETKSLDKKYSESASDSKILSKLPNIIFAKDALTNELYITAQQKDPTKHYMCRYEGPSTITPGRYTLCVYFPALREWSSVDVEADYKLTLHSEVTSMTPKVKKAPPLSSKQTSVVNAPQAKSKKGSGVFESWGQAFTQFGIKPNAPKLIVEFMEKQFPGRKTKWAKWVNTARNMFNKGKLPDTNVPAERIKPYK
jgi:hypothetical protein